MFRRRLRQALITAASFFLFLGLHDAVRAATPSLPSAADSAPDYILGPGDKLRISVFNEPDLSRDVQVGVDGKISFPLVGGVNANGKTSTGFAAALAQALDVYVRHPRVTAEILEYRPFFIMGEVRQPGFYPYSANLTVNSAVARAGGFTERAAKSKVFIKRAEQNREEKLPLTDSTPVRAGDTIRIGERMF